MAPLMEMGFAILSPWMVLDGYVLQDASRRSRERYESTNKCTRDANCKQDSVLANTRHHSLMRIMFALVRMLARRFAVVTNFDSWVSISQ
jgi:hypothetical protein